MARLGTLDPRTQPKRDWKAEFAAQDAAEAIPRQKRDWKGEFARQDFITATPFPELPAKTEVGAEDIRGYATILSDLTGETIEPKQLTPQNLGQVARDLREQLPSLYKTDPERAYQVEQQVRELELGTETLWEAETTREFRRRPMQVERFADISRRHLGHLTTAEVNRRDEAILDARDPARHDDKARSAVALLRRYAEEYPTKLPADKYRMYMQAWAAFDDWKQANPKKANAYPDLDQWSNDVEFDLRRGRETESGIDSLDEAMMFVKSNPLSTGGRLITWTAERVPFEAASGYKAADVLLAVRNIKNDKADREDWIAVARSIDAAERYANASWAAEIWDMASRIPGYATEFAFTGGAYTAIRKGLTKAATKAATKVSGKFAQRLAVKTAIGVGARVAGVGAQTLVRTPSLAKNIARAYTPDFGLQQDAQGRIELWIDPDDPSFLGAFGKGFVRTYIETGAERSGRVVLGALGKPIGRMLAKIPAASRIAGVKAAIVNRLLSRKTLAQVDELFKKTGWHGLLGEFSEERVEEVALGVTGLEKGYGATGAILRNDPEGWRQFSVEIVAFMFPGAGRAAAGAIARIAEGKAPSREQVKALGGLDAAKADTEANRKAWYEANKEDVDRHIEAWKQIQARKPAEVEPVDEDRGPRVEARPIPGPEPGRQEGQEVSIAEEEARPEEAAPREVPVVEPVEPVEEPVAKEPVAEEPPAPPAEKPPAETPPEEKPPEAPDLTSIKGEIVKDLRAGRGVPGLETAPRESVEKWLDEATALWTRDRDAPDKLLAGLAAEDRNLDERDVMLLQMHYRALNNRMKTASKDVVEAVAGTPAERVVATAEAESAAAALLYAEGATQGARTRWGRTGVALQQLLKPDFSIAGLTAAAVKDKRGALDAKEAKAVEEIADRLAALEEQLREVEAEKVIKGFAKAAPTKPRKLSPAEKKAVAVTRTSRAWDNLKDKFAALKATAAVYDPKSEADKQIEATKAAIELVRSYLDLGVKTFVDLIARVTADVGASIVEFKPAIREAWDRVKKTGEIPEVKIDREKPDSIGRLARKLTRSVVESGITDREAVVGAVHEDLSEILGEEWTRQQTMDAISGYGRFKELPKDEVSKEVRRISGELQQLAKLEDMAAGKAPKKTGIQRREVGEEERQLIAKVNEAKKRGGYEITDPERQLKSALDSAKTAVKNQIADLDQEIRTRERIVKERKPLEVDPELKSLRERRNELKAEWDKVFPKEPLTDAQKAQRAAKALDRTIRQIQQDLRSGRIWPKAKPEPLSSPEIEAKRAEITALRALRDELRNQDDPNRAYRTAMARRLADLKQRIAEGDFAPRPLRKEPELNQKELDLLYEYKQEQRKFRDLQEAWKWARRTKVEKVLGVIPEAMNLSRLIITAYEASAVLRQGMLTVTGHPIMAAKGLPKMFAAIGKKSEFATAEAFRRRPLFRLGERAGLHITETEGPWGKQEEIFMSNLTEKIPGIAASARMFTTIRNYMGIGLFDGLAGSLGSPEGITLDEAKVFANFANVWTGRGWLSKLEPASVTMAVILFAPRYVISRFQILIGQPIWTFRAPWKGTGKARLLIAKEYARSLIGLGLYYGAIQLISSLLFDDDDPNKPTIEWNWRSSDFGKIRIGNTRIDPLAGLSQSTVLIGRMVTGETKRTTTGEIVPIRKPVFPWDKGEKVPFGRMTARSALHEFLDRKLSPAFALGASMMFGETAMHEDVTFWGSVADLTIPITYRDIYEAMQEKGLSKGAALGLLAFFGQGLNTWEAKKKKSSGVLKTLRVKK